MTKVLLALRNIFLERIPLPVCGASPPRQLHVEETIRRFIAARQLYSYQIAFSYWDGERDPWFDHADAF